jgi:transposase
MLLMTTPAKSLPDDISELKGIIAQQVLSLQKYEEETARHREDIDRHREEAQLYREEVDRHRSTLQLTQEELARSKAQNERLMEIIRLLRHRHFGRKSEKVEGAEASRQLGIFNEAEVLAAQGAEPEAEAAPDVEVKGYRRRGKPKRVALPADLPREDVVIELSAEERRCPEGHELKEIGEDVSERLDVIPAQIKVIRTIRKKYACPCCEAHVKRAPLPPTAIPKSIAGPGLLAYIATSKYGDGLPLYRQEHMWQRAGVDLPRATMAAWMIKVGELFTPLLNLMGEDLLARESIGVDETTVQVLNEEGKAAASKSYMWVRGSNYPGAPPIVLFEYDPTRSASVPKRLLEGYCGYLQTDAYPAYQSAVGEQAGIVRVGCMAHCRRKFFEATKASAKGIGLANEAIETIRDLYAIEEAIRDKGIEDRHRIRQEGSKPILDQFRTWLDENLPKVPPQSQLGKALGYAHSEWTYLTRYLDDGRLAIDNNFVENAIRPFAVGRKNWLFSDSVAGAKASAAIYSIIVTAKQNGHNEYAYLRHILEKLPLAKTLEDYEALLPYRLSPEALTPPPSAVS